TRWLHAGYIGDSLMRGTVLLTPARLDRHARALGMLGKAQPGLRHGGPERLVALIRRQVDHPQADFRMIAIIRRGTHVTIPSHALPEKGNPPRWAKSGWHRGHSETDDRGRTTDGG